MAMPSNDLESLLSQAEPIANPRRGDLLTGRVIAVDEEGLIVDLGKKRDGVVPRPDFEGLPPEETDLKPGDEVAVMVVNPEDRDGNLVVSLSQARASGDWVRAQRLMENETIVEATPCDCNRGGLVVPFGRLRGFVPASHLSDLPRGLDEQARTESLRQMLGRKMPFKVIEVDPQRRRLVLSERKAIRQWRQDQKSRIIDMLHEGEVRKGVVTSLREFGAFVDIGGADGLIHLSEISWLPIEDPSRVLRLGQEVEAMVIRLDRHQCRIGLSLRRLQPMPWEAAANWFRVGQAVEGTVTRVEDGRATLQLDGGLEGFLPTDGTASRLTTGDRVRVRIARMDVENQQMELGPCEAGVRQ